MIWKKLLVVLTNYTYWLHISTNASGKISIVCSVSKTKPNFSKVFATSFTLYKYHLTTLLPHMHYYTYVFLHHQEHHFRLWFYSLEHTQRTRSSQILLQSRDAPQTHLTICDAAAPLCVSLPSWDPYSACIFLAGSAAHAKPTPSPMILFRYVLVWHKFEFSRSETHATCVFLAVALVGYKFIKLSVGHDCFHLMLIKLCGRRVP